MTSKEKIQELLDGYRNMGSKIFTGEWGGGNKYNPFEYNIIHNDKISAHRYMGMVEAFETALKILEDDKAPD